MQEGGEAEPAEVQVLDAGEPVEVARLPILGLADGRPGALWRGQVFPLAADGSIDIAGPFFTVEDCVPRRAAPGGWSVLAEGGEVALLLAAGIVERERVLAALRAAGIGILRTTPVLDPDLEADWVVRLDPATTGEEPEARLREVLDGILGGPPPAAEAVRIRLLELQLDRLRRENEELRRELERARAAAAPTAGTRLSTPTRTTESSHPPAPAEPASTAGEPAPPPPAPAAAVRRARLVRRLGEEIAAFLSALPRIELLCDSILTLLTDYRDRRAVYRVLGELDRGEALQRRFKPVRGCEGWQECHVSTGQDDSGRIYARRAGDRWLVLVSLKEAQRRDVERLDALARRPG